MSDFNFTRDQLSDFLPTIQLVKSFERMVQSTKSSEVVATETTGKLSDVSNTLKLLEDSIASLTALYNALSESYTPPIALGSMAQQNSNEVSITGGNITNLSSITTAIRLITSDGTAVIECLTPFNTGASNKAGTLTNAPVVGNPTKWIPIIDAGVTRYIPVW